MAANLQKQIERQEVDAAIRKQVKKLVSAPVKLLHESLGFQCTVELKSGEVYRGLVVDIEDNWNIQLQTVIFTDRTGKKTNLEHVYLRGSQVRFVIVPDMLRNSPVFTRFTTADKLSHPITSHDGPAKRQRRN